MGRLTKQGAQRGAIVGGGRWIITQVTDKTITIGSAPGGPDPGPKFRGKRYTYRWDGSGFKRGGSYLGNGGGNGGSNGNGGRSAPRRSSELVEALDQMKGHIRKVEQHVAAAQGARTAAEKLLALDAADEQVEFAKQTGYRAAALGPSDPDRAALQRQLGMLASVGEQMRRTALEASRNGNGNGAKAASTDADDAAAALAVADQAETAGWLTSLASRLQREMVTHLRTSAQLLEQGSGDGRTLRQLTSRLRRELAIKTPQTAELATFAEQMRQRPEPANGKNGKKPSSRGPHRQQAKTTQAKAVRAAKAKTQRKVAGPAATRTFAGEPYMLVGNGHPSKEAATAAAERSRAAGYPSRVVGGKGGPYHIYRLQLSEIEAGARKECTRLAAKRRERRMTTTRAARPHRRR